MPRGTTTPEADRELDELELEERSMRERVAAALENVAELVERRASRLVRKATAALQEALAFERSEVARWKTAHRRLLGRIEDGANLHPARLIAHRITLGDTEPSARVEIPGNAPAEGVAVVTGGRPDGIELELGGAPPVVVLCASAPSENPSDDAPGERVPLGALTIRGVIPQAGVRLVVHGYEIERELRASVSGDGGPLSIELPGSSVVSRRGA